MPKMRTPLSLADRRQQRDLKRWLTGRFDHFPDGLAEIARAYRFLLGFGSACVQSDKYPPLTRCWNDLERRFMKEPLFEDGLFVHSWALMDFRFGPNGETALDYFAEMLESTGALPRYQWFIDEARRSRPGFYQRVLEGKDVIELREAVTGRRVSVRLTWGSPIGDVLLTRLLAYGDDVYFFGFPHPFPSEIVGTLENQEDDLGGYEDFMSCGPFWMSVASDHGVLAADHHTRYLDPSRSPELE